MKEDKVLWEYVLKLVRNPNMKTRSNGCVERPKNTLTPFELYSSSRWGLSEGETFMFLNKQVDGKRMRIHHLNYVLTARGLR